MLNLCNNRFANARRQVSGSASLVADASEELTMNIKGLNNQKYEYSSAALLTYRSYLVFGAGAINTARCLAG